MQNLLKISIRILIFIIAIPLFWLALSYLVYRMPKNNEHHVFEGEIKFKFIELGLSNRGLFEDLLKNNIIRIESSPALYVSASDHKKLWTPNPHDMQQMHFTYKAKLSAKPLLFGGYGLAEVVEIERINKDPIIRK